MLQSAAAACFGSLVKAQSRPPNIIVILADDLGYGDLGCYGSKIPTPNLDRMAADGVRLQHFYSASPVCSPSRAGLLTGRYPVRSGVTGVLFPQDHTGLPATETTLPQVLRTQGYRTACVGKWHLGCQPEFLPMRRGFDEFLGVPYSNDMGPPLLRDTQVLEPKTDINLLTQRFTQEAVDFVGRAKDGPFFLYLAHTAPHIPLGASPRFRGASRLGPYGDVVQELDWSVGQVLGAVRDQGLDERTLVVFTSDNGPWYQGSTGTLRGRKGETYDGGVREPFLARFPGRVPAGTTSNGVSSTMDLLPTLARLAGATLPATVLDGVDIWPLLAGTRDQMDRNPLLYFDGPNLQCARDGRWKLHLARYNAWPWVASPPGGRYNLPLPHPELYDMEADPEESYDLADSNPQVIAEMRTRVDQLITTLPQNVRDLWRETMAMPVEDTPTGSLPVRQTATP